MIEPSRLEWVEWRQDHIEAYIAEHPLPRTLLTFTKQARRMTRLEIVAAMKGQTRLEDFA
jgi:hypothetical protein